MQFDSPRSLMDVLPPDLFRPLSSANREHNWRLLTFLYDRFFGMEADFPPAAGWTRRDIQSAIEMLIEHDDPWDEDDERDSNPNQRANRYLRRLIESGWMLEEQVGLAQILSMPPMVSKFMETLVSFIEQSVSPPEAGAKMRSIEAALQRVFSSPQPGADLDEAALQARQLVGAMSAMGLRVREVMRALTADVTTAQALKRIFDDYITKTYIADYAELTGADHPLARKSAVMQLVNELALGEQRTRLIAWYAVHRTGGSQRLAEDRFDRTVRRLRDLNRIQDFLERLEDDLRRMNRRMLALIDYRLHAPSHLEVRLKRAIAGVQSCDDTAIPAPAAPGQILSGSLLYKPRRRRILLPIQADRVQKMTPEQEARMRLRMRARDARRVQSKDLLVYLSRVMGERLQIMASEMPIESIKDFRVVQTLASLAHAATAPTTGANRPGVSGRLPRYSFSAAPGRRVSNGYFEMPDFHVTKVG